ncbi:MAG TPA: RluA family pseudouridine synthase [Fibrobacteria bacterium]|nr:RluA family pseudouridine synthase [Fibrobacteria bacterium]HOX50905.1 RluA family pseudouridine synthase [Fibrobacteria bacterium]
MTAPSSWQVEEESFDERWDRYLAGRFPHWSRTLVQGWLKSGQVLVDGEARKASFRMEPGQFVQVLGWPVKADPERPVEPQDIPLSVVWEDARMAVIDKPAGLTVHPGAGCPDGTLANALAHRYRNLSGINGPTRPGIVHRLDRDTSGLLVVALDDDAHRSLASQLVDRSLSRTYDALAWGIPASERVDAPIGRDPHHRTRMAVVADGRSAATRFRVRQAGVASLVECSLETGRTHQIRVHLAYRGHPVVGDELYGGGEGRLVQIQPMERTQARTIVQAIRRQCLHARALRLIHPDGRELRFESPWPSDFQAAVQAAFPGGVADPQGLSLPGP